MVSIYKYTYTFKKNYNFNKFSIIKKKTRLCMLSGYTLCLYIFYYKYTYIRLYYYDKKTVSVGGYSNSL